MIDQLLREINDADLRCRPFNAMWKIADADDCLSDGEAGPEPGRHNVGSRIKFSVGLYGGGMGIGWPVAPRERFIHRAPFAITIR